MTGTDGGIGYVKSVRGVLKILEIILLVISIATVVYFWNNLNGDDYSTVKTHLINSFIGVTAAAGVIALVFFVVFVAGFNLAKTAAVFFILLAILLFVASGFLAHDVKILKDTTACKKFELFKLDSRCEQLITGTVCGFIAGLVFLVDGIIHCRL